MSTSYTPRDWRPPALLRAAALAALAALAAAPSTATARPYRSQFEMSRGESSNPMDRIGVFVDWTTSNTDYNAKFDISGRGPGYSTDVTYKARGLGTQSMVPRFGMTYVKSDRLLLEGSVGVSFYDFEERTVPVDWYSQEHQALTNTELRPGLSVEVGGLYTWKKFGDFAALLGARGTYRSASKNTGDEVSAVFTSGTSTRSEYVRTDDVNVRTLALTGSAGLEWRPRNTWLVNNFGVAVAAAYTFGSIDHRVKEVDGGVVLSDYKSEVDIGMTPADWIGVYYGWSWFLPRVGVFSLEGQFLAEPRVTLTYEYLF